MEPARAARPVVMAAVAGAHGIAGEVRLKLFTASVEGLKRHRSFDAAGRTLTLKAARPGPQGVIARFAEIGDRAAAEALRGTLLSVPRESLPPLPEGEFYWHDLIGLAVEDEEGVTAGTVVSVENFGASDLLEVERPDGRRILLPMVPQAVLDVGERVRAARAYLDAA